MKHLSNEEARSWANFWTGLAVATLAVSVLPVFLRLQGMGLSDFASTNLQQYVSMAISVLVGIVFSWLFQTQAILALRRIRNSAADAAREQEIYGAIYRGDGRFVTD